MSARQTARTNPHQQSIKKSIMSRVRVLYAIFAIVAVAIFGMILVTQYGPNGGPLRNRSDLKCYKMLDVPASRGNIYAHDGRILATDSPSYNISLDFTVLDMSAEEFNREANALADSLSRTIPAYSKGYFVQRLHAIRNKALRGGPGSQNQRLIREKVNQPDLQQGTSGRRTDLHAGRRTLQTVRHAGCPHPRQTRGVRPRSLVQRRAVGA